ncbi:MAG: alpha-hydroxy-acid oxidizing protein [Deltaproteobacteria bacterium]|nr:MAG: alpha-hydroxy-acid oxidizing protein [Deltaproteobacteria bacterium]
MQEKPLSQMGLREIRDIARLRMSHSAWEHVMGAAESRATFRRNQKAFGRFLFRQRIFHDVTDPDTSVELFGRRLTTPAFIAPIGSFSLIGDRADHQVAEGAGLAGTMLFASHAAKPTVQEWAEATSAPIVFMAYLNRGKEDTLKCVRQAESLGYAAVGITMDTIQPVKIGDEVPLSTKDGKPRKGYPASAKNIEWLKSETSLPVVIKGIMGSEDARIAVNAGADALIVSNHGGRILDFNRAAIEVLPEVVAAVGDKVTVLLDSGIRSGGDIVKALALGAKAVLVGRPIAWGVGAAGVQGVVRVVDILTEQIKRVLILTGVGAVSEITESILIQDQA